MRNKWYGSLQNRLEEGHQFCDTIKVGTGVTEYQLSTTTTTTNFEEEVKSKHFDYFHLRYIRQRAVYR